MTKIDKLFHSRFLSLAKCNKLCGDTDWMWPPPALAFPRYYFIRRPFFRPIFYKVGIGRDIIILPLANTTTAIPYTITGKTLAEIILNMWSLYRTADTLHAADAYNVRTDSPTLIIHDVVGG
jgi:hypothetical protein